jgi:hypothetical protein
MRAAKDHSKGKERAEVGDTLDEGIDGDDEEDIEEALALVANTSSKRPAGTRK